MEVLSNNNCNICHGALYIHPIIDDKVQYHTTVLCECVKGNIEKQSKDKLLKSCEFPPFTENMSFDNFRNRQQLKLAYDTAKNIAQYPNKLFWLTLMGANGVGKTHLAVAICKSWVKAGIPARYVFVPLLLDELREGFKNHNDDSYTKRFNYYCRVPLLLLDDLGRESSTQWVQEKLETIVDYRLMNKLSLIITTNKSLDEISPVIASRLSRLHEESKIISIMADDYVLQK